MKLIKVSNPSLPYAEKLHDKFKEGTRIRIKAKIDEATKKQFQICLHKGTDGAEIIFTLAVRRQEIVRNTAIKSVWGPEEKFGGMPIRHGVTFELLLIANEKVFKIIIDGVDYADYTHRSLLENIDMISIDGDGIVYSITEEYDYGSVDLVKQDKINQLIEKDKVPIDMSNIDELPFQLITSKCNKNLYFIFN